MRVVIIECVEENYILLCFIRDEVSFCVVDNKIYFFWVKIKILFCLGCKFIVDIKVGEIIVVNIIGVGYEFVSINYENVFVFDFMNL